ncbi:MAG: TIGR03936 family radical SAM-associated protein, partial [Desulfobacteraceae bacterium]|nr:TIGR03936 family radical SAM-associated protein [Desulfobacteraceae bacterium]
KHLGHLELAKVLIRAFRRAGLKLAYSRGYHPMPKVSFFAALPVGTESIEELVDIELIEAVDIFSVKERLNHELPLGIDVILVKEISPTTKRGRISESQFLITLKGPKIKEKDLRRFLESDHFSVVKTSKKGNHEIDARALVSSISHISPNKLQLTVKQTDGPGLKPTEIVKGIFSLMDDDLLNMDVLKIGQILA